VTACGECLGRAWLLGRLAGHLDPVRRRIACLLELDDEDLIAAVGGSRRTELLGERRNFDPVAARTRCAVAGVTVVCRCDPAYPPALRDLAAPPSVLHIGGSVERAQSLLADQPVAIVGARRPSPYGAEVARSLARSLAGAAVTVVSGLAQGIDAAAHEGALDAWERTAAHEGALETRARTMAVLPGGADRPYPASARRLQRRIASDGVVISELPPGTRVRRWMFPARSRIIAALSAMTVVVEARAGSGALLTAGFAAELGRALGAVPGRITSPLAEGPHELLREGAQLVGGPQDVLDGLFGVGQRSAPVRTAAPLAPTLQTLLDALADGSEISSALSRAGLGADRGLGALAALELAGRIRREPGGRFSVLL